MFRLKLAMIIGGIVLVVIGVQEWRLAQEAKVTPQTITCADLSAKGPGDNAHIVLTDGILCDGSFVYESKNNNPKWNRIWVPIVPKDGEYMKKIAEILATEGKITGTPPVPQNIKVILKSKQVANEAELGALANQPTITGMVMNKIESLGQKEREILQQNYPGTDFTQCYIFEHDRKPAGMGQIAGLAGGGVAVFLLGLAWMFSGSRSRSGSGSGNTAKA